MTDLDLLESYHRTRSDEAFRGLIDRYINLVYSACHRQLRDAHLAEDATQAVFILLSQRSGKLGHARLSGWLLTAARYTCANIQKSERRRAHREQVVAMLQNQASQNDEELLRLLDQALAHLRASDREAVARRFLQNQPLPDISRALGISEVATRKRIDRALLKLRGYFVRHGVATTSAALGALLPSHSQAAVLIPAVQESLTNSILQFSHAGAEGPCVALAKGVKVMMFTHSLKTAAIAGLVLAIMLGGAWALLRTSGAQIAPEAAPAVPVAVPAMALDLSTPEKTLASYCLALRSSDRAGVYACCTVTDPTRPPTTGDAFLAMNLSQNHLIRAAGKAFTSTGNEARQFPTLDLILGQFLTLSQMQNRAAVIDGNSASMTFNLPDSALAAFPDNVQKQIRSFANSPIRFVKLDSQWKISSTLSQAAIALLDANGQPINDVKLQLAVAQEYAAIFDRVASAIEAGQYHTWDEAHSAYTDQVKQLHQKYNFSDFTFNLTLPATQSATLP